MPKISRVIPETEESITRPVVYDILRQLMDYTGIPPDTQILFPGHNEAVAQGGSTISKTQRIRFNENASIRLVVDEDSDPDYLLSSARFVGENLRVFHDPVLDIHIKPQFAKTKVKIDFTYRGKDAIECERWRRDIEARVEADRGVKLYKASYHYIIPEAMLAILLEIHRLRENHAGYGQDWNDWFTAHLTPKASVAVNLAGRQGTWVVSDTQSQIQGYFDFEGKPEKSERNGEAETHELTFTYTFEYEKPISCSMRYPAIVHQQILSTKYRPAEGPYNPADTKHVYGNSRRHLNAFERKSLLRKCNHPGIAIPSWDEFLPRSIPPSTKRVFTAMVAVPPNADHRNLFNLTNLGTHQLLPEILDYLRAESQYVHVLWESPFTLSLYRGIDHLEMGAVKLLPDLTVQTTNDIDPRQVYHVRLGLATSIKSLSARCRRVLMTHGKAAQAILGAIDCSLASKGLMPPIVPDSDLIPDDPFNEAIDEIDRDNGNGGTISTDQNVSFKTVQLFTIKAMRGQP